jgi:3-deoxy-D-manno-octulosonate 8-phosphate phosphatase (KDO 8-P phosphatase)
MKHKFAHITTFVLDIDGVLTNGEVLITEQGEELRTMHTKDGQAIAMAAKAGYKILVVSGARSEGCRTRLLRLGATEVLLGFDEKLHALKNLLSKHTVLPQNALYMGDDLPDLPCMQYVGMSACPADAVPEILNTAQYISSKNGGTGCVREIIEQVMRLQNTWQI